MAELDWQTLRPRRETLRSLVWDLDWLAQHTEYAVSQQWSPCFGGQRIDMDGYCAEFGVSKSALYANLQRLSAAGLVRRRGPYLDILSDLLIKPWRQAMYSDIPAFQDSSKPINAEQSDITGIQDSRNPGFQESLTPSPAPPSLANPLPNPDPATPPIVPPAAPPVEAVNDELAALWEQVLPGVQRMMMPAHFTARAEPLRPVALEDQTLVLESPTSEDAEWMLQRYGAVFRQALREATNGLVIAVDIRARGQPP